MQASSAAGEVVTDTVQRCEGAGVTLTWLRRRDQREGAKHWLELKPQSDGEPAELRGPYRRAEAEARYDAMAAALLTAARQQRARLRAIMERRSRATAPPSGRTS